jgi:hypothetical protein
MANYTMKFGFLESKSGNVKDKKVYWKDTNEEIGLYSGSVNKGLMNGEGELTYNKSKVLNWNYKGSFKDGKEHGSGEKRYSLEKYEGNFDERRPIIIKGSFSEGYPSGKCVLQYANGTVYEGNVEKQNQHWGYCRDGYGICKYNNQDYTTGKGVLKSEFTKHESNFEFEGEWRKNKRHGKGCLKNEKGEIIAEGIWHRGSLKTGDFRNVRYNRWVPMFLNKLSPKTDDLSFNCIISGRLVDYKFEGKLKIWNYWAGDLGNGKYEEEIEYKNGLEDGSGFYIMVDDNGRKREFEGEFNAGKKNGTGREVSYNGSVYNGYWKNDKYHGQGIKTWAIDNKDIVLAGETLAKANYTYEGDYKEGEINGKGTLKNQNGEIIFEGEWKDNLLHKGTVKMPLKFNEEIISYVGTINNGVPDGTGVNNYPNGDVYEGEWQDGKHHGQGTKTWAIDNKDIVLAGEALAKAKYFYEGEWAENKINGKGILKNQNGEIIFEGEWKDNLLHKGTVKMPLKFNEEIISYVGTINNGVPDGTGVNNYPNGDVYDGLWKKGKKQGFGTLKNKTEKIIKQGLWYKDDCITISDSKLMNDNDVDSAILKYKNILLEQDKNYWDKKMEDLIKAELEKFENIKKELKEKQIADLMNSFDKNTSSNSADDFDDFK